MGTAALLMPSAECLWDAETRCWFLPGTAYGDVSGEEPKPPPSITMRQARLALLQAGLLDSVKAAIANMEGAAGEAARIEWEYAATIDRDNALFGQLAASLGLSGAQIDALFTTGAAL